MSDPMHHDSRNREMRNRAYGDRDGLPIWAIALVSFLVLAGALMYFTRDNTNTVANTPSNQTSGTATNSQPMTPPGNPGSGSGSPQGAPANPSTTGSAPAR
jgi:hypothetical protein